MRARPPRGAGMAVVRACVAAHVRDARDALSRKIALCACLLTGERGAVLAEGGEQLDGDLWRLGAVHTRWNGRGGELCAVVRRSGGSRAQLEAAAFPIYRTTRAAMYPRVYT